MPSHSPATYNLDQQSFDQLDRFCTKLGIRGAIISKLRTSFRRLDHDNNGRITLAEFLVVFGLDRTKVRPAGKCELSHQKSLGLDICPYSNGRLSIPSPLTNLPSYSQFSVRAFSLIDTDNSGTLDFFEFVASIWNYCTMDWETLVRYAFDLFDVDGSGQLETKEIERLVCYVAGSKKPDSRR